MKLKITYLNTGRTEVLDVDKIIYNADKIVLVYNEFCFSSFFHGDKVTIETVGEQIDLELTPKSPNWETTVESQLTEKSDSEKELDHEASAARAEQWCGEDINAHLTHND